MQPVNCFGQQNIVQYGQQYIADLKKCKAGGGRVKEKATDDLRAELMEESSIQSYLKENQTSFRDDSVAALLTAMFERWGTNKAALARRAGMSEVYLHQVFSGRRSPSRDRLLCICVGMAAPLEEIQALLRQAGYAEIYPKLRRDAIICHGILHQKTLSEINDTLFAEGEKTLF